MENGVVYFGSEDGKFYALNASTGKVKWSFLVHAEVDSSPAVSNGAVYFGAWSGYVYALNAATGRELWSFGTGDSITTSSPAVEGGRVFIGSLDHRLYALSAASGRELWVRSTGAHIEASPTVAGNSVFVGSDDGSLYEFSAKMGSRSWYFPDPNSEYFPYAAVASGGSLYVTDRSDVGGGGFVYGMTAGGGLRWTYQLPGYATASGAPAVAYGTVYVGTDQGLLVALNAATGKKRWSVRTGGNSDCFSCNEASPAVADHVVLITNVFSAASDMVAVNASTGKIIKRVGFGQGDDVYSSPAVAGGRLYVGSNDFGVYAFGVK